MSRKIWIGGQKISVFSVSKAELFNDIVTETAWECYFFDWVGS